MYTSDLWGPEGLKRRSGRGGRQKLPAGQGGPEGWWSLLQQQKIHDICCRWSTVILRHSEETHGETLCLLLLWLRVLVRTDGENVQYLNCKSHWKIFIWNIFTWNLQPESFWQHQSEVWTQCSIRSEWVDVSRLLSCSASDLWHQSHQLQHSFWRLWVKWKQESKVQGKKYIYTFSEVFLNPSQSSSWRASHEDPKEEP